MTINRNGCHCSKSSVAICTIFLTKIVFGQQQLDCNFDQKSFCNWSNGINGVEDDFDWQIDNTVAIDGFHSIPRTIEGSGYFTFAQGRFRPFESDAARAWLRSPIIEGTSRPATLSFFFWKTAVPPVLQVCTRDAGDNRLRCLDTISGMGEQRWSQRNISIPGNASPFQIVFVATGFRTALDLVGIDDIIFRFGEPTNIDQSVPRHPVFLDSAVDKTFQSRGGPVEVVEYGGQFVFPTPPVAFETYRPIYSRIQNPFDQDNAFANPFSNVDSADNHFRFGDKLFEKPFNYVPTGRPEVYYVTPSAKIYENSRESTDYNERHTMYTHTEPPTRYTHTEPPTMYTHTEPPTMYTHTEPPTMYTHTEPHYYLTTPSSHAYSSTIPEEGSEHFYQTTVGDKTKGRLEPETGEPCAAVNCFFDSNFCLWYNDLKANFDWKLKSESSSTRGIISDTSDRGSYAFVNGDTRKREQRAALRSPSMRVPNGSFLDFTTFVSDSTTGHLTLKSNDVFGDKVLWESFGYKSLGGHGWNRVRVPLPSVKYPLMLILEVNQIANGQFIGIDDLRLSDQSGDDAACTFNSSMYDTTIGVGYTMMTEYGKEFYHRGKPTTAPVLHSPVLRNNYESNAYFASNSRFLDGEVTVDVLGEHGGSILKPELVDASLTTKQPSIFRNDIYYKQNFFRLENDFSPENNRQQRFQNLIDKSNFLTDGIDSKRYFSEHESLYKVDGGQTTVVVPFTLRQSSPSHFTDRTAVKDIFGVNDFVRRVGSDLTTLLGINRQSYIFGADVFNRIPSVNARRKDDKDWFNNIFGKKK